MADNVVELKPLSWLTSGVFMPPKDVGELLDRCVEFAEDELRWANGEFFCVLNHGPRLNNPICNNVSACAMGIIVLCRWDGPVVEIATGEAQNPEDDWDDDGMPHRYEIEAGKRVDVTEHMVTYDKMALLAAKYVAAHIPERSLRGKRFTNHPSSTDRMRTVVEQIEWAFVKSRRPEHIVRAIVNFNDEVEEWFIDVDVVGTNKTLIKKHHQRIVKMFKDARDHAKRDLATATA